MVFSKNKQYPEREYPEKKECFDPVDTSKYKNTRFIIQLKGGQAVGKTTLRKRIKSLIDSMNDFSVYGTGINAEGEYIVVTNHKCPVSKQTQALICKAKEIVINCKHLNEFARCSCKNLSTFNKPCPYVSKINH